MELQWEAIEDVVAYNTDFSSIIGKDLWIRYFTKVLKEKRNNTYLLIGEPGNGKKTLAKAVAGEAVKHGYSCHSLYMDALLQGDIEWAKSRLVSFCRSITEEKQLFLLFSVDRIQKKKLKWLLSTMVMQLRNACSDLIIIATAEDFSKVPEQLSAFAEICPINPPKKHDAVIAFKKLLGSVFLDEKISDALLEKKLEGCSMMQLDRIAVLAKHSLYVYRMEYHDEKEEEIASGLRSGRIRLSLELLEKAISDVAYLSYNRFAKQSVYTPAYSVVPQSGHAMITEEVEQRTPQNNEKESVSIIDESMGKVNEADVQSEIEKCLMITREGEPSEDSLDQLLKEKGEYTERIELDDMELDEETEMIAD